MFDSVLYALLRKYIVNTLKGAGALKGASCQIQSIARNLSDDATVITFKWENNAGEITISTAVIPDGKSGSGGACNIFHRTEEEWNALTEEEKNQYDYLFTTDDEETFCISIPEGGTAGQVLVKKSGEDYDAEWKDALNESLIDGLVKKKIYTPVDLTLIAGKRINNFNGNIYDESTTSIAEIPVKEGERYLVTGAYANYLALYGLYDADDKWISLYPYNTNTPYQMIDAAEVIVPQGATMLKICGSTIGYNKLFLFKVEDTDRYSVEPISDVLYDKKWYALGDSFTFGDFTNYTDAEGKTYEESDAFDPVKGMWKTYPWHIEKRTGIKAITKLAANGMRFTNIEGATNAFSADTSIRNYTMIPNDCDYVTLAFGLNEANLTAEQIGTSADTTNATLWGAYNTVLESIITANPLVKIGIIITDAWMTQAYHDALVEIAKYWGIPYLDLKNGEQVPMMIDGELREHSTVAQSLRDATFQITSANAHPTPKAHEYRSTVIENFLRSL